MKNLSVYVTSLTLLIVNNLAAQSPNINPDSTGNPWTIGM
jgi:hypothetical protein